MSSTMSRSRAGNDINKHMQEVRSRDIQERNERESNGTGCSPLDPIILLLWECLSSVIGKSICLKCVFIVNSFI